MPGLATDIFVPGPKGLDPTKYYARKPYQEGVYGPFASLVELRRWDIVQAVDPLWDYEPTTAWQPVEGSDGTLRQIQE